jgi:zinc protease
MEDLSAASLDDVKDFFRTYYAPNNACLVVAGDINPAEVKPLVEKYFGPIRRGKQIERPVAAPVVLPQQQRLVFEDKVQLPRLYLTWHSAANNTREDAVLTVLSRILTLGKNSRLYQSLVYDQQIAQSVQSTQNGVEIAGQFQIEITPKPGGNLTRMEQASDSILQDVLKNGVTQKEIDKSTTVIESRLVNQAATVLGKATNLAAFYSYTGDPTNVNTQMDLYKGITPEEVVTVAKKYLPQPNVVLSIVPLGKTELAAKKGE